MINLADIKIGFKLVGMLAAPSPRQMILPLPYPDSKGNIVNDAPGGSNLYLRDGSLAGWQGLVWYDFGTMSIILEFIPEMHACA